MADINFVRFVVETTTKTIMTATTAIKKAKRKAEKKSRGELVWM